MHRASLGIAFRAKPRGKVFLVTDPGRSAEAAKIVRDEYARFLDEGPTESEMIAARNKAAASATLEGELPMGRLLALVWYAQKARIRKMEGAHQAA